MALGSQNRQKRKTVPPKLMLTSMMDMFTIILIFLLFSFSEEPETIKLVPPGSGVFLPDELMGNVSKLNVCNAFWRVMALAGDIGGGLIVTLPSLKELKNPEVKDYVEEFYSFGSDEPTENIMKVHKLLQHWTAGLHGVGTWHGAGPVMAQKIMLQRVINYDHEKDLVKRTLKLKEKEDKSEKKDSS